MHVGYILCSYGVQATGQVKWRHFLGHFMSPVKEDGNMTAHTDSASEQPDPDLQDFYPYLREIFHLLDKKAAGWITRADLRLALKVPHFHLTRPKTGQHPRPRLSCFQITDLLNTLDPEHMGFIQLPTLERLNPSRLSPPKDRVALLHSATATAEPLDDTEKTAEEQKASDEKQNTQRADNTSPASASWRIVESLLLDRLCEQLGSVLAALKLCDPQQTGHVKREDLRTVIVRYGLPISLTHFKRQNTSPQTTEVSAGEHQPPSSAQSVLDDIFKRMKERLEQLRTTLAARMQVITHNSAKTYSGTDLRKMLEDCFITLDDNNFHRLTELLGFKDGRFSLSALQAKYDDFLARDSQQGVEGCDEISAAEKNLADMKNRIKIILGDNMKAFRLMDKNHDGLVDCRDFKKLYFSLGYAYWGEEYQHLLNLIGLKPGRNLNYTEFCNIMENNGHHNKRKTANVQDQLHALLVSDARDKWRTMSQELCRVDAEGRSLIFKKALKYFLFTYKLPIRSDDFERLWSRYDTEGRGFVTVADFLNKLGVDEEELWPHKQKPTHTVTPHQADKLASSDDAASLEQIEQILLDNHKGVFEALTRLDETRNGKVKVEELLSLLQTYGCSVQRDQLIRHLRTLNVSVDGKHRLLSYLHFLSAFGHTAERCEPPPATPDGVRRIENLQDLRPALALVRMQELVTASAPNLHKAFSSFDPCGTGTVKLLHFRQVLENFCARLSDKQFRYLLNKVDLNSENYNINWKVFLDTFNSPSPLIFEDRAITARSAFEIKTYLHKIQEVVSGRLYEITKDIMDLDRNQNGTVSKDDFRKLCDRCFMRLTSNQFECVWNQMPVNEQGKLQYREFLKRFGAENKTTHTQPGRPTDSILSCSPEPREIVSTTKSCRPKTADAILQDCKSAPQCISRPASTPGRQGTGSPSGSVEQRLRGDVQRCWKKIQRKCNERDPHRQGEITTASFLDILQSLNISVTQEEFEHLAMKFDITRNGQVSYPMFLRHFLLNLKPAEGTQMFERRRLPLPATLANQGVLSRECVESMLRIYEAVKLSWSSMRRSFRTFDRARTGYITIQDFMKVLCHFNVNLSSEEFFHLSSYFDASATGKISYNDFLRVFLS
ncbi:EF-hand calcium-binding domain-containing protein 6 [Myripristis murdjan]|uniref:EF-hand calcium-binding domain-containing protein 6 n=1 Tax=Myripristis murdjan TaxID=586833 RepID=UPI001176287F|nr:EF-hand calcium-binding domain-containing protein 6-like [Myripristis murdjan]